MTSSKTDIMQNHQFKISVIMPVYNVEEYLEEAINSVIGQTLGFRENIQLILVNDGSPDNSGTICSRYASLYPDNIVYVNKENGGVSSARNAGMQYIRGQYVNFMDSDDIWAEDAFEKAFDFFSGHPEIDILSARMLYLNREGQYHLDYEYDSTKVIKIEEIYDHPLLSVARAFISAEAISDKRFDEDLSISEDVLFINDLILEKGCYGLIREVVYYYRKREEGRSALDTSKENVSYYTNTVSKAWGGLVELSVEKYGSVIPYIQYLLITDIQWRFTGIRPTVLNDEQWEKYKNEIKRLLSYIDDDIILSQRRLKQREKIYAIKLKSGEDITTRDPELLRKLEEFFGFGVSIAEERNGTLCLIGIAKEKYIDDSCSIYAEDDKGIKYDAVYYRSPKEDKEGLPGTVCMRAYRFRFNLPLADSAVYSFYLEDGSGNSKKLRVNYNNAARLGNFNDAFFTTSGHIVKRLGTTKIGVYRYRIRTEIATTQRYIKTITDLGGDDVAGLWKEAYWLKRTHKKPIWIISDDLSSADDNGAALFDYLVKTKAAKKFDIYYLLDKTSADFPKMEKLGKVLTFGSREHYLKQIAASLIVSTCADKCIVDFSGPDQGYYRNLMEYRFAYIQSRKQAESELEWRRILNRRICLLATSSNEEFDAEWQVKTIKLTGENDYERIADELINVIKYKKV